MPKFLYLSKILKIYSFSRKQMLHNKKLPHKEILCESSINLPQRKFNVKVNYI